MFVFTFYLFTIALAILSFRFAVGIFTKRYRRPRRSIPPFGLAPVFCVFALFLVVSPLCAKIVYENFFADSVPSLESSDENEENVDASKTAETLVSESTSSADAKIEEEKAGELASNNVDSPPEAPARSDATPKAKSEQKDVAIEKENESEKTEIVDAQKGDLAPSVAFDEIERYDCASDKEQAIETPFDVKITEDDISTLHPMARMLVRASKTEHFTLVTILFFVAVVIVAPLVEELVFRVALQGYLERKIWYPMGLIPKVVQNRATQKREGIKRLLLILFIQAGIFAVLHAGSPEDPANQTPLDVLLASTIQQIAAGVATLIAGFGVLVANNAKGKHLGFNATDKNSFQSDLPGLFDILGQFWRGFCFTIYISPIVLFVNVAAQTFFPEAIVAPIPIFVFALAEGFAYFHTRSYPTVVGMHVALNFGSFAILYASITQFV